MREQWCIPPRSNADFVYHMEDVLSVYLRPSDPRFPQVCMDETPVHLRSERIASEAASPGHAQRYD